MVETATPLKYHMNDLVYYLGISCGGNLGKQIAYLGAIGAMMKGMLYRITPESIAIPENGDEDIRNDLIRKRAAYARIQDEVDTFRQMVEMIEISYRPQVDTNPYMFPKARRIRKGVQVAEVLAFHIIEEHNLISGNMMRARLVEQFGKGRIKGGDEYDE